MSDLLRTLNATAQVVEEAEAPADPFEAADVADAALRLGHTVVAYAERIAERHHRWNAAYPRLEDRLAASRRVLMDREPPPPDDDPPPPPPDPPPPPPPTNEGSQR